MANDGKSEMMKFTKDQIEVFREFDRYDQLPDAVKDANYAGFIATLGPLKAVNALHMHLIWKRHGRA